MKFDKLKKRWEKDRVRRQEESAQRLKLLTQNATPVFKKYRVVKAILFGSTLENRSQPDSDIDLFIHPLKADKYWDFIRELENTVGLPVDVYTDTDDEVFVRKILERGKTIYEEI